MPNKNVINISSNKLADIFWPRLYAHIEYLFDDIHDNLRQLFIRNNDLRSKADYNTGSVGLVDAVNVMMLVHYFDLQSVAEVGTFIGNSTLSMAYGMELSKISGEIHTCDMSNEIELVNPFPAVKISQYQKQSSTDMLRQLCEYGVSLDLCYLDGRLQDADLPLVERLVNKNTIIALDDFEGMEKGVANLMKLTQIPGLARHILIHPPSFETISTLPVFTSSTTKSLTAALVPLNKFVFTRQ